MFTSIADVFRTRQVVSDLTSYVSVQGRNAFRRMTSVDDADARLDRILLDQGGRFCFPIDVEMHGDVQLSAALPDDDFPAFTCATALLLLDRLCGGAGDDDMFWNWEAFSDHYRLADPPVRAALMNGFRIALDLGVVSLAARPDPVDCLTSSSEKVLSALRKENSQNLIAAIEGQINSHDAALLWLDLVDEEPSRAVLAGVRHLYERPLGMAPPDPKKAPLIPWTL